VPGAVLEVPLPSLIPGAGPARTHAPAEMSRNVPGTLSGATAFITAAIALVWINNPVGLWKVVDILAAIGILALSLQRSSCLQPP
jgi:hypothetical protein